MLLQLFFKCCISETYLDATVAADDKDLVIEGYNLVCADHPSTLKKGGVSIYYKESLAVQLINVNYLNECLFVKLLLIIVRGTLQYYTGLLVKLALLLITFFQILKKYYKK